METRVSAINGVDTTYLTAGRGPLMLLLHGFPDSPHSFRPQIEAFSRKGWQVVAPYMRGYAPTGLSPDGKYHTAQLGADAIALIKSLGHDKAVVVGHDYGAAAAYAAAFTEPRCVDALIAVSVPHGPELAAAILTDFDQLRRSWYIFLFQQPFAEIVLQFNGLAFIDRLWAEWSPGFKAPPELLSAVKESLSQPGALSAALGYYRTAFGGPPTDPALAHVHGEMASGRLAAPTLYVHGADDGCVGVGISDHMHKHCDGPFERVVIEGAGHFVHAEQPDRFNDAVERFLAHGSGPIARAPSP